MHHFRNTYPTNTNIIGGYLIPDDEDNNTLPLAEINIAALQLTAPTNLSTVSIPYSYRYGFNGQERETSLNQSVTSAEYWFYDGRLGRRWNVDPVFYPGQSSYSAFNNNPIIYTDPTGESGELTIDDKSKTVTLNATLHLYGSKATPKFAQKVQDQINNDINNGGANGKGFQYAVGKEKYKFISNVKVDVISEQEALKQTGFSEVNGKMVYNGTTNSDYKNNYVRVDDMGADYASRMDYNNGIFNINRDFNGTYGTATHEFLHSLGLTNFNVDNHSYDKEIAVSPPVNGHSITGIILNGQPDIMTAKGTLVPEKYGVGITYNYNGNKYKAVDTRFRIVRAKNINDIVRGKSFELINGIKTMKLGNGLTNRIFDKNGNQMNIIK